MSIQDEFTRLFPDETASTLYNMAAVVRERLSGIEWMQRKKHEFYKPERHLAMLDLKKIIAQAQAQKEEVK